LQLRQAHLLLHHQQVWQQVQAIPQLQLLHCLQQQQQQQQQLESGLEVPGQAVGWVPACCALPPAAHHPAVCLLLLLPSLLAACLLLMGWALLLLPRQCPWHLLLLLLALQEVALAHALLHQCLRSPAAPQGGPGG
jgi:hypothetical protein